MKTLLVLHLICLWAQNDASPILSPNGPVYITNGGSLALTCEIDQNAAAVNWLRNGIIMLVITNTTVCSFRKLITLDTYNYSMTCDQQRSFTMVRYRVNSSDDNTTWSCQMYSLNYTDLGTSLVVRVLMHVPVGSVQLLNGTTLTLNENQSAVFVCETDACRPSAAIYWMKDGINITDSPTNVTEVSVGSDLFVSRGTLTYTGQRGDNRRILTCGAYNGFDSVQISGNLTVTIYYPPKDPPVIKGQANGSVFTVIENTSQTLTCRIIGGNPLANLSWICLDHIGVLNTSGETVSSEIVLTVDRNAQDKRCTCRALHQLDGNKDVFIILQVQYPPSIEGLTSPHKVIEYQPLNVTCQVSSNPIPDQIFWSPNGDSSVPSTLYFSSISRNKSGTYSCKAQNTMIPTGGTRQNGTNTSQIQVDVMYPPSIQGLASSYKVIENQLLNVTCEVNSNPPADQISWSPSGEGSVPSTLYFSSVLRNKSGTYSCKAQNTMIPTGGTRQNGTNTSQIQVDVLYPPSIQGLTSPYKVIENQPLNVTCVVNSNPPADKISWSPSGEGFVPSILYFLSASRNKSGIYSCTAQNTMTPTAGTQQNGTTTSQMQVDVLYPPSIQGLASSYKVIENQPLNVTCEVNSNPPADQISWYPSGEGSVPATLYFSSVSRNKRGIYSCKAQNTMIPTGGTRQNGTNTNQIQVDVLYGAGIVNLSVHDGNTVNENASAIFKCHVDSNPSSTITWMKESNSTILKTDSGVVQSQYIIKSAECLNMDNYSCSAYNGISRTANETIQFFVRCHPRTDFRLTLETKIYRKRNEAAVLRYTVISYPLPTFNWTFLGNGSVSRGLPDSASQHDDGLQSEVRFTSLNNDDFGNYSVIASNSLSPSAREVFEIIPAALPSAPKKFFLSHIDDGFLVFGMEKGFNGGYEQIFIVEYQPFGMPEAKWSTVLKINETDLDRPSTKGIYYIKIPKLQDGQYIFRVYAENKIGNSSAIEGVYAEIKTGMELEMKGSANVAAIAGGIGAAVVVVIILVVLFFIWRKRASMKKNSSDECFNNSIQGRSNQTSNLYVNTSYSGDVSDTGYESLQACKTEASPYQALSSDQNKDCSESMTIRSVGAGKIYINTANTSTLSDKEYECLQSNQIETNPYQVLNDCSKDCSQPINIRLSAGDTYNQLNPYYNDHTGSPLNT